MTRKLPEPPVSVGKIATTTSDMGRALSVKKTLQKAFVSVQLEKVRSWSVKFLVVKLMVLFCSTRLRCGITC